MLKPVKQLYAYTDDVRTAWKIHVRAYCENENNQNVIFFSKIQSVSD